MVTWALTTYSMGLLSFTMVKVLLPAYYARHDSRTPFRTAVVAVAANLFFNMMITVPWARAGWIAPHAGLALSTSLASFVNAWQLTAACARPGLHAHGWLAETADAGAGGEPGHGRHVLFFCAGNLDTWMARTRAAPGGMAGSMDAGGFRECTSVRCSCWASGSNDLRVKGTQLPSGATPL